MNQDIVSTKVLVRGKAAGHLLHITEPLNLFSGLRVADGVIVEAGHPEQGRSLAGTILAMWAMKGAPAAAGIVETIRLGCGPAGIVLHRPDPTLAMASIVARHLYGAEVPVVVIEDPDAFHRIAGMPNARIDEDGRIGPVVASS